jgi:hypothetical protein
MCLSYKYVSQLQACVSVTSMCLSYKYVSQLQVCVSGSMRRVQGNLKFHTKRCTLNTALSFKSVKAFCVRCRVNDKLPDT